MSMTLSVIIPCYNAEPFVAQTIRSVLEQTRPPDEIIVVDDGSTDGSVEVVRQFGDRVRLLTGRNGGASPTRNKGLDHATGDALMFLDADDVLGPTALEALTDALRPGAIAACLWYRLDYEGGGVGPEAALARISPDGCIQVVCGPWSAVPVHLSF
jgi:glycosyltransferase involved in cell wall biosynthesis